MQLVKLFINQQRHNKGLDRALRVRDAQKEAPLCGSLPEITVVFQEENFSEENISNLLLYFYSFLEDGIVLAQEEIQILHELLLRSWASRRLYRRHHDSDTHD